MDVIRTIISTILLGITLTVTYSIATVCGAILAFGTAVNYPFLKCLGWLNGR